MKIKNAPKKHLIRLFEFLCFCPNVFMPFSALSAFGAFSAFSACEIFWLKKKKSLKLPQ